MVRPGKKKMIAAAAGVLFLFFTGKKKVEVDSAKAIRNDFKTSTQRMGVSFGQKIRSVFRFRWIKRN